MKVYNAIDDYLILNEDLWKIVQYVFNELILKLYNHSLQL